MPVAARAAAPSHTSLLTNYLVLLRFVVPLVCVNFIHDLSEQVVDAGIAHDPSTEKVTATLAAFGVCWYICILVTHTIRTVQQVALVLGRTPSGKSAILRVYSCAAVGATVGFVVVGLFKPCSDLIFVRFHRLPGDTLRTARLMIVAMAGFPPIVMLRAYYSGILSAQKTTGMISAGAMVNVFGVCFAVLALKLTQQEGSSWVGWEPVVSLYVGELLDLATVSFAARRQHRRGSSSRGLGYNPPPLGAEKISVYSVLRFAWPLVLREAAMGISRPMINLWVARGSTAGAQQLSVLVVVFPFVHVAYGWLNELRSIAAAYADDPVVSRALRSFYIAATGFSLFLMWVMTWSPASEWLLTQLTGIPHELFERCVVPLRLFTLWPPAVALRSYTQSLALRERCTERLAPAGPLRVLAIFVVLQLFSAVQEAAGKQRPLFPGAVVGTIALCAGFWTEALACALFFRVDARRLCCWCFPCCCNPPARVGTVASNCASASREAAGGTKGRHGILQVEVLADEEEELGLLSSHVANEKANEAQQQQ